MKSIFKTLLVSILLVVMAGCNTNHNDWKVEAERTNQMQIHENGLTERQTLSSLMVAKAVEEMNK